MTIRLTKLQTFFGPPGFKSYPGELKLYVGSNYWVPLFCSILQCLVWILATQKFLLEKKQTSPTVFLRIVSVETILFWIWPYVLWPLVTVNKSAETIQGRKLFAEIRYLNGPDDLTGMIVLQDFNPFLKLVDLFIGVSDFGLNCLNSRHICVNLCRMRDISWL